MNGSWEEEEAQLRDRADGVRRLLGINEELQNIGVATLTGSAGLRVMVARDIDLTVAVPELDPATLQTITALGARLARRPQVRVVTFRNDSGPWNIDPGYPDGLYLYVQCRDDHGDMWSLDIWFVDQPDRQPDLEHLRTLGPRIDQEAQTAILAIKRATNGLRPDGTRLPSYEIYRAVLDHGLRTVEQFTAAQSAEH